MSPLRSLLSCAVIAVGTLTAADTKAPATPGPAVAGPVIHPVPAAAPVAANYDSFRLILDRNIFSSSRYTRRERSNEEPEPRVDTITLVGTLDYEKGTFAIFDGSESAYRKSGRIGDSVGPFKITDISGTGVELERDGHPVSVQLAQQLRRPEGADWSLIGAEAVRAEATAKAAEAATSPEAAPVIPAGASDTLRRLMEQRQKQLKQ